MSDSPRQIRGSLCFLGPTRTGPNCFARNALTSCICWIKAPATTGRKQTLGCSAKRDTIKQSIPRPL